MSKLLITTLFLDIGGVLLTNGWGRTSRALAAKQFNIDLPVMEERHHLCFDSYERGKVTMDEYLAMVVFHEPRPFGVDEFKSFVYSQSQALPGNIEYFKSLKEQYNLRVIAVNNEPKEINEYRIQQFQLHQLFDAFVSSCYVGFRKPDKDIFRLAIDIAQANPQQAIYIDDRKMFVEVAAQTGLQALQFSGIDSVKSRLEELLGV